MAADRVAQKQEALALLAAGYPQRDVAARVGVARTTLQRWLDPERAERDRATARDAKRRRRDSHPCPDCGTPCWWTSQRCKTCARRLPRQRINAETCIAAMRRYGREHDGETPRLREWIDTKRKPSAHTIIDRFGSWRAACAAAGFTPRPSGAQPGHRKRGFTHA